MYNGYEKFPFEFLRTYFISMLLYRHKGVMLLLLLAFLVSLQNQKVSEFLYKESKVA